MNKVNAHHEGGQELLKGLTSGSAAERQAAARGLWTNLRGGNGKDAQEKALNEGFALLSDLAKKLEGTIDTIAGKKGLFDTRLQG